MASGSSYDQDVATSEATSPRLTAQHVSIIQEHPIPADDRASMRKTVGESAEGLTDQNLDSLLYGLAHQVAARLLSWPTSADTIMQGLLRLVGLCLDGRLSANQAEDLADSILTGTDQDIWQAVLTLIYKHARATDTRFPSLVDTTYNSTASNTTSSSWRATEDSYPIEGALFKGALFKEIVDCTYQGVGGFFPRFFDRSNWGEDEKHMLDQLLSRHDGRRWVDFPAETTEENISAWLVGLQESCLRTQLGRPACNLLKTNKVIHQWGKQEVQMDIFFESSSADATRNFAAVLVASELTKTNDSNKYQQRLLQLLRYARRVFYDQPLRYYVHAFLLSGSVMEAWVVDRSGPISSGDFDINDHPDLFARMLVSYATMGPADMGLNTLVKAGGVNLALTPSTSAGQGALSSDAERRKTYELFELVDKTKGIVCRGTTCYLTCDGRVVKFAWTSDKRPSEASHLQRAKCQGVTGVAMIEACEQITSVDELRAGLITAGPFRYRSSDASTPSPARAGPNIRKRTYEEAESLTRQATDRKWENRVLTCMAICPAGRVLSEFGTVKELVEAMLDAIRAHRSLFVEANILHRDISPHNIIITEPGENNPEGYRGMLIDLDMAKSQDAMLSGAPEVTGTLPYMSIAVLLGKPHSCRDDLESFLYTLMRLCGRQAWINVLGTEPPSLGKLVNWGAAKPAEDLAALKALVMNNQELFEEMMEDEFPKQMANVEAVKRLCMEIRSILFTGYDRKATRRTDPEYLYSSIIMAFEETLQGLAEHSSAVSPIGSASADVGQSTGPRRSARQRRNA